MTTARSTPQPEGRPRTAWAGLAAFLWLGLVLLLATAGTWSTSDEAAAGRSFAPSPAEGRPSVHGDDGRAALPAGRAETLRTLAAPAPGPARRATPGDGCGPAHVGSRESESLRPTPVLAARSRLWGHSPAPRTCERLPYHATAPPVRPSRTA